MDDKNAFERINEARRQADEAPFINPRNLTTGTLKTLDPATAAQRPMSLVAYGLGEVSGDGWATHSEASPSCNARSTCSRRWTIARDAVMRWPRSPR